MIEKSDSNKTTESLLREGDVLILDRGFRDVAKLLEEEFKFHPKVPYFLAQNQKQLQRSKLSIMNVYQDSVCCGSYKLLIEAEVKGS